MRYTLALAAALGVLGGATTSSAQTVTLDEGTFRISVNGKEVGTETFSIRQNGTGESAVIIAVGKAALDSDKGQQEISSELQAAGRTLRPVAYEVRVQGAGAERITGRLNGNRFSAQIMSPAGESMREYLAGDGAVLADQDVAHHYYFLARRVESGSARVPVIIPRQNRQVTAAVSVTGTGNITVGGTAVSARQLTVAPAGGSQVTFWVDGQDRVLRVEIPSEGFAAQRVDAPK